jgi:hypothetical protein
VSVNVGYVRYFGVMVFQFNNSVKIVLGKYCGYN